MKVFTASLSTETNTFSPMLTGRAAFLEQFYAPPGQHPDHPRHTTAPLWVLRQRAKANNWQVVEGLCTAAQPAGTVSRAAYEEFRDDILAQLKAAMPVDMVCMGLHGAMVAEGYDDCEGDMLQRIRAIVGPKVPIGSELDPHCHMTEAMLGSADVLICYKEFPHTDFLERAEELVSLVADAAQGKVKPVKSVFDCRMIQSFPTSRQPMRGFVDRIKAMEGKDGILSISVVHCYPYADVPDIGAKILVITDDRKEVGDRLAETLGRELIAMRDAVRPAFLSIEESLDQASMAEAGPIVIAEPADNAGGGAPSDSTFIFAAMRRRGIKNAAIAPLWDPIAVKMCFAAGEGATFDLRFGGKMGRFSGPPVDARVKVIKCVKDATQSAHGTVFRLGDAAAIDVDGIAVVLVSVRGQAWGTDLFSNLGIDPTKRRIIVVKSTNHFYGAYSKIAEDVLYTDGPGALPRDFSKVPYTRIKRPIWPLDADPWS
ncbi:MAG: M81 family metallopeptidase [Proteobacteria bacterium]|nr:M81 family metallopeptidase [Pseudomonadota bacterium]MBI3498036.1 M81 family metallopeptidase [Pseudomonadota bacterium]